MDGKRITFAAAVLGAAGLLGGCAVYSEYPAYSTYPGAPVAYGHAAPLVVAPAPVYVAPPHYGPTISLGIFGRTGHGHHHRNRHGHGHHGHGHNHGHRR